MPESDELDTLSGWLVPSIFAFISGQTGAIYLMKTGHTSTLGTDGALAFAIVTGFVAIGYGVMDHA